MAIHLEQGCSKNRTRPSDLRAPSHGGQVLARDVLTSGGNGILYPSVRQESGLCLVALRPHLVQNIRQGAIWDFVWAGAPVPTMTKC